MSNNIIGGDDDGAIAIASSRRWLEWLGGGGDRHG
jgi:hypothetical protein